jgi:hypothetical protein
MVWPALHVGDALAPKLLLKARRAPPRGVLAPLVGQDLPGHPIVGNRPRQRLQNERAPLMVRHHQAHEIARVIVQERRHVHPLLAPQKEGKEIRLPQLVGLGTLKAPLPGPRARLHRRRRAQPLLPEHPAHRRLRRPDPEEAPHHVPDAPAPGLRLGTLCLEHRLAPRIGLRRLRPLGLAGRPPLQGVPPASPILLRPLQHRRVRNAQLLRYPRRRQLLVDHHGSGRQHHIQRPGASRPVRRDVLHLRPSLIRLRLHLFTPFGD